MPEESNSHLPTTTTPNEVLARYLTQRGHYRLEPTPSVKPSAFDPPSDLRLSVFRIDGLTLEQVWVLGQSNVVNSTSSHRLHGWADIVASSVREVDPHLDVDCDNTPPRHACIVGWPEGPENKPKRVLISQKLAAKASLKLRS